MDLPEPFRRALSEGDLDAVRDLQVQEPVERYARGLVRARLGAVAEARADFEAVRAEFPDEVEVELAFLDFLDQKPHDAVLSALAEVLGRVTSTSPVRARALHVKGRVLASRPDAQETLSCLLEALDEYRLLSDAQKQGEVFDTLGMVHAFDGRLDAAAGYYALAIARKSWSGDRAGAALTLGNLGRLQLRAGRFREALECFELDLEMARTLGDLRGEVQMLNDVGRARLALGDVEGAIGSLEACRAAALERGFDAIAAFACKDLALALITGPEGAASTERRERAAMAVSQGALLMASRDDPFAAALLAHAEGMVAAAMGKASAVDSLTEAVRELEALDAPDFEIPALLDLAGVLAGRDRTPDARLCLSRALHLAHRDGHARYLAPIREVMEGLDLPAGADVEEGRLDLGPERRPQGGSYTPLAKLGSGGFGDVYRALDVYRNREVALKLLRLEDLYDAGHRRALFASIRVELEAASRIRHPGVAAVYAIGTDDGGGTYVVQEYVPGTSLQAAMPDDVDAPLDLVLRGVRDIADALQALHDAGVVHRDLKPANVIIRPDGRPVLIDMGVAYLPTNPTALGASALVGTFSYMAPEQATGKGVDGRADVYSLGVVLYEWLTGLLPIHLPERDLPGIVRALLKEHPIPLEELRAHLPDGLVRLVASMLAKARRQRPTAHEVARRLDAILSSEVAGDGGG